MLPFTRAQFFDVFSAYNHAVWPAQIVLLVIALTCAGIARRRTSSAAATFLLALLWAWMGVAFQLAFFTRITSAGWAFGALFLVASALFVHAALAGSLRFGPPRDAEGMLGVVLVVYSLVGYPVVGALLGHQYPAAPTFGMPCPTTIFTLGMLLLARRPRPLGVAVIPLVWSAIGSVAAFRLGVLEDLGLLAAGIVTAGVFLLRAGRRLARTPSSEV